MTLSIGAHYRRITAHPSPSSCFGLRPRYSLGGGAAVQQRQQVNTVTIRGILDPGRRQGGGQQVEGDHRGIQHPTMPVA